MINIGGLSDSEKEAWIEMKKDFERTLMWGLSEEEKNRPKREDYNVKLAYVILDGKRKMIGVDNQTMEGYAMYNDKPEWIRPLQKIKYDSFERWCRSMDI